MNSGLINTNWGRSARSIATALTLGCLTACGAATFEYRGPAGREHADRYLELRRQNNTELLAANALSAAALSTPALAPGSYGTASDTSGASGGSELGCNGHAALCDRPYNDVVYPATHNSHAAVDAGYHTQFAATQKYGVARQLDDGIRALLLDVTYDRGETTACHGLCSLGRTPHSQILRDIRSFLKNNPREVVTIIYEDQISTADMEADFVKAGLIEYVYARPDGAPWPTLGEMVAANTRLVVSAENGGEESGWYRNVWKGVWETPYGFHSAEDFSCRPNRGTLGADLFLLNHWLNSSVTDLPSAEKSIGANQIDVLLERASRCRSEGGQVPNFIAVDYYDRGDLFTVVDVLNGVL